MYQKLNAASWIRVFLSRSAHLSSRDRNWLAVPETVECNLRGVIVNVANRDEHMKEHACGMSRDIGLPRAYGEFCACSQARPPVIPALRKSRNAVTGPYLMRYPILRCINFHVVTTYRSTLRTVCVCTASQNNVLLTANIEERAKKNDGRFNRVWRCQVIQRQKKLNVMNSFRIYACK